MTEFDTLQTKELNVARNFIVAGRTGRPAYFEALANARLGGWFNASKSQLTFGAAGSVTGKASAHNMELTLPNQDCTSLGGVYCAGEFNLGFQLNTVMADNVNYPSCFGSFQLSGTQAQRNIWEASTGAAIFHFGGLNAANGEVFDTGAGAVCNAGLKIIIDGVAYWIMLTGDPTP